MAQIIPPVDPHSLIPQLLACLPTAFVSPRPPPALVSLLSPILQQRLQLLSSDYTSTPDDTWLKLLCWDSDKALQLQEIVESTTFEPHPVSGELEIGDLGSIRFKRYDSETLRCQIPLPEWNLTVISIWCSAEAGRGEWKVAELEPYDPSLEKDSSWHSSVTEAANSVTSNGGLHLSSSNGMRASADTSAGEDDSDYWAQYDRTPGRTPAKTSPAPGISNYAQGPSEQDYYARYGDVQPAMDADDPSEQADEDSTLNGNTLAGITTRYQNYQNNDFSRVLARDAEPQLQNPQPSPPPSQGSDTVAKLEETAESHSFSEIGIRQHISTSVKSMYRLARSCGIERDEFQRMINRELDVLALMEE
ncbi:MAG: hypothetical protein Q9160_002484 [Pyrenula sp. 1 TL-2023]